MPTPAAGPLRRPPGEWHRFTSDVFAAAGMASAAADTMADHLLWAELRDITWLGLRKVPLYIARIQAGTTNAAPRIERVRDRPAFALLDADDGFAQIVGVEANSLAVEKARRGGVGAVSVRNTTSGGALGHYVSCTAAEGVIGMVINNSPPLQAAAGGIDRIIGNQAFAIASPARRYDPLLLDMATSATTFSGIDRARERGGRLAEGMALTADGVPTTDPEAALAGALLPMGGSPGFAIAVLWEVLTGVLGGGDRVGPDVTMPDDLEHAQGTSMLFLAIDPAFVMEPNAFTDRVDALIDLLQASPPVDRDSPVAVPGQHGFARAERRRREGITVPADLAAELSVLAQTLGIDGP